MASGKMFFGMRSCKYVTTTSSEDNNPKTKILRASKIKFYKVRESYTRRMQNWRVRHTPYS